MFLSFILLVSTVSFILDDISPVEVSILVLVAPELVRDEFTGSTEAACTLALDVVTQINLVLQNSDVAHRVVLAGCDISPVSEEGVLDISSYLLRTTTSLETNSLRDEYEGDQVTILTTLDDECGTAWVLSSPIASYAFSVVNFKCIPLLSPVREFGYNAGCCSDQRNEGSCIGSESFSYGYRAEDSSLRTVMSFDCPSPCPIIPYFSNPKISVNGYVIGNTDSNNARTLNMTMRNMSLYRGSPMASGTPTESATTTLRVKSINGGGHVKVGREEASFSISFRSSKKRIFSGTFIFHIHQVSSFMSSDIYWIVREGDKVLLRGRGHFFPPKESETYKFSLGIGIFDKKMDVRIYSEDRVRFDAHFIIDAGNVVFRFYG
jgi:hypothetical protein